ncbi:MAG: MurR/RpiR family transcriptional regulator [Roseovarius sp.]|nr:MurR/RpiR family transcriptional regulator [Roseovarius sp.]MCY4208541.1 MurR/RpiR family transcriptional regulator [Roseovarius sp.]MCY4317034.1 MurR/RpiR family transcriptional regulator [Roseovarius sp.]
MDDQHDKGAVQPHSAQVAIDVISNLNSLIDELPNREMNVARFVRENLEAVTSMSIAELAKACEVSSPTVVRFCRSMGCDGYREFKMRLAQNLAVSLQYMIVDVNENHPSEAGNVDQIIGALSATVNIMRKQLDSHALSVAKEAIADARSVLVGGIGGGSSMLAEEAANRLFRLGIPAAAVSDSYLLQMRAATLQPADVLLLISASGEATEIVTAAEIANGYGAKTLAISKAGSRLTQLVATAIEVDLPEDPDVHKPTASRYAYLVLIDALAMSIAQYNAGRTTENLRRIRASLTAYHGRTGSQPLGD